MDRAWNRTGARLSRIGLLGGSFNPAHRGHRRITLNAIRILGLDGAWWLVSPGNPLKDGRGDMASLAIRLASARRMARRAPIRATDIEVRLGTRYTLDTIRALKRRFPRHHFIWLMGSDNLAQFHRWRDWRRIAQEVPIAVIDRPGYESRSAAGPAAIWFRRFERRPSSAKHWTTWRLPALVRLRFRLDPSSATALRLRDPEWQRRDRAPVFAMSNRQ